MMPVASLPASASGRKHTVVAHPSQPRREQRLPRREVRREGDAGVLVLVGELACQRAQLAAVRAVAQRVALDDRVPPELQPAQRPEPLQPLPLAFEQLPRLERDHLAHQGVLVGEVMVELRLARVARRPDIVKSRRPHAPDVHQLGGRPQNPRPGGRSACRQPGGPLLTRCPRHSGQSTEWAGRAGDSGPIGPKR